tara:strand:+ start:38 stop:1135 length:1098 start_codon:yes stop_codon:yes gene_type:complete
MSVLQPNTIYNIVENTISQNAIQFADALDNSVDKIISIASTGLSLKRDILTTAVETIITPLDITDVNTGNSITMARLTYLPIGLGALTIPTIGGTTCNFNDAIQLQDYNDTPTPPLTHSEVKIGSNPSTLFGMNINTNTGTPFTITGDTSLTVNITDDINLTSITKSITLTAEDNLSLVSSALGNINLDAPNINSYSYAMPICFTRERVDTFTYNLGGGSPQTFENVYTTNFALPYQFVSDTPQSGYFSSRWKIEVALNCYNSTNLGDKGLAFYISFEDQNSNIYLPLAYNDVTPHAKWQNPSTYFNGSWNNFQNFNWTDLIDLSALSGTGSGTVPFNMRLWCAGDTNFSTNFNLVVTLTRTNLI